MEQLPPTNSAAWTPILVESFIRKVGEAATRARYVAAGGKNLKAIGWNWVLNELEGSGNLVNITQLQTKWKRLKTDYSDYDFLKGLSGFGDGFEDAKWAELDERPGKLKLSRFRNNPFTYYELFGAVVGDTMATGVNIQGINDIAQEFLPTLANNDDEQSSQESQSDITSDESSQGDLSAAEKRAKILHQLKKNRKRRSLEQNDEANKIRQASYDTMTGIKSSLDMLVRIYAAKNNLSDMIQDSI